MNLFIPFTKSDDEQRMVYGYASTEALDSQGEIVAREAIIDALPDYMRFGNIREMHQPSAVGKAQEATVDEKGLFIGVKVVDDTAWQKVKEAVYNGFSIGGKIVTKIDDTITKLRLTEISLVDRPANPEAVFAFYKGDDMGEENQVPEAEAVVKENLTTETDAAKSEEGDTVKSDDPLEILKRYMGEEVYDTQTALNALENMMWLLGDEKRESENNPEQIAALQAAIKNIKAFIVSEIQEDNGSGETGGSDVMIELSDNADDVEKSDEVNDAIAKAGASISRANKDKLSQIMALCKELMGEEETDEGAEKGDEPADLAKGEDIAKAYGDLQKAHDEAIAKMATMQSRIDELEQQPATPKGSLLSVAKGDDYEGSNGEEVAKASIVTDSKGEVNEVASLIKMTHQIGGVIVR